jgi:glycosyltransferase involved in cell wall biosynthesis
MAAPIPGYVLITPARNEETFIGQTIESMIAQTVPPLKWVIVSDGSTDRTDGIVREFLPRYSWMELIRRPERAHRDFAAKVKCFTSGYEAVQHLPYDIIGNLDADITFAPDYLEFLLARFAEDPGLGVAGTPYVEGTRSYDYRFASLDYVSGACQLFRRRCFADIGGYTPIKGGGIDWLAVTTARMKGWRTRTFTERVCHHHRPTGTASCGRLRASYATGRQDYYLGWHPVWETLRGCFHMTRQPYVTGGLFLLVGYWWAWLTRLERPVSSDVVEFHRREQIRRLQALLRRTLMRPVHVRG